MKTKSRWVSWRLTRIMLGLPLLSLTAMGFAPAPPVSIMSSTRQMVVSSGSGASPLLSSNGDCGYSTITTISRGSTWVDLRWGIGTSLGIITSYYVDVTLTNGDSDSAENNFYLSSAANGRMDFSDLSPTTNYSATLTGTATVETDSATLICTLIPGTIGVTTT